MRETSIIWQDIEAFAIFCVCVANKPGKRTEKVVEELLVECSGAWTPFMLVRSLIDRRMLKRRLKQLKTGQYDRITRALTALVTAEEGGLDLWACGIDDLEQIHGIGPKTSRYFLLRTRENAQVAALDTHVLKWLRSLGYDVPKNTPGSAKRYAEVESWFLKEAKKRKKTPADLDSEVWSMYAEGNGTAPIKKKK